MEKCEKENAYAAVKASNLLEDDCYLHIKEFMQKEGKWTNKLQAFEEELKGIALQII